VSAHALRELPLPPRLVAVAGLFLCFSAGALVARHLPTGLAVVFAILYTPLVLINLPAGLAVWIALVFIEHLPVLDVGPTAASLLVLAGWAGTIGSRRSLAQPFAKSARFLPAAIGLLLAWLSLSALWAHDPGQSGFALVDWLVAAVIFGVVATTITSRKQVVLVMLGFVCGALLSVVIGLVVNGLSGVSSAYETATQTEGRLSGGSGDPNYLAAGVVPAIVLAAGLFQQLRGALSRLGLSVALVILVTGLAATQSRGGLLAAAGALVASLVIMRGRRRYVLLVVGVIVVIGGLWFSSNPAALQRVTSSDQGGNGRTELWAVAWRMGADHPLVGVGLNNYLVRSPEYARDVGTLRFAELIAERPHVAHNAYLQLFAETGLIGLALFLIVVCGCLRLIRDASRRFAVAGDALGAALASTLLIAILSALFASFFLSNGPDKRLWFLLGLVPPLLTLARSAPVSREYASQERD